MKRMIYAILAVTLLACPAAAGDETVVDGVIHVSNGDAPSGGVHDLELEELWRRGGEDDEVIFGVIAQALADTDGNVYLLDSQLSEVHVFDADGEFVGTLSREGDGPGEVRQPFDMLWMPDGTLGLVQSFPGKIIQVNLDGTPAGVFQTGEEGAIIAVVEAESNGGNLVLGGVDVEIAQGGQVRHMFVSGYDAEGAETGSYIAYDVTWDFSNMVMRELEQYFVLFNRWGVRPDGGVVTAHDFENYELRFLAADGTLERIATRPYEPFKRDEAAVAIVRDILEAQRRQFPFEIEVQYEEYDPPVASLFVHPGGDIWVQTSRGIRGQPEGVLSVYDVFSPEGHFIRQERILCPGNALRDGIIFAGTDRLLVIHGLTDSMMNLMGGGGGGDDDDEAAPVEVVCYRIKG